MNQKGTKFKAALGHPPGDLADGRVFEAGQILTLDAKAVEDPHNARLIAEGRLLQIPDAKPAAQTKKESD